MNTYNLVALSGSLRKGSYNSALLRAFAERAPEGVSVEFLKIDDIPHYNADVETAGMPDIVEALKGKIGSADGVLIATPEYNRSVPGVLKNAIDWSSRPTGKHPWKGKPVYVMGASSGPIAAALAQYDLKKTMTYLNAHVLGQPEFYCGNAQDKFDADGALMDEKTKEFIDKAITAFTAHIDVLR